MGGTPITPGQQAVRDFQTGTKRVGNLFVPSGDTILGTPVPVDLFPDRQLPVIEPVPQLPRVTPPPEQGATSFTQAAAERRLASRPRNSLTQGLARPNSFSGLSRFSGL